MGIYIQPQGDITVNESAIKNTDAEMRDGVWSDSTKPDGANISYIYGNTSTLIKNTSLILIMGSNDATLENQSAIIQYNQTIDAVVDGIKTITDVLPDSGALTSIGTVINQSLILVDGDNLLSNTSSLIGSNSTIDTVADAIKTVTDAMPDSGALTSIGQIANQSLMLVDGDNLLSNTSSLIASNTTIDVVVDGIKTVTDVLPDSGTLTSLGTMINQTHILIEGEHFSHVFPENTGYTITMHTGAANTYGPYNIILDDQNNTLSDKFNNTEGHISSMLIEDASVADKTFQYEISYGVGHTAIIDYRFHSATNQIGPTSQTRIRPCSNPAGEVLYYRGMCENASANIEVSFRYHFHP